MQSSSPAEPVSHRSDFREDVTTGFRMAVPLAIAVCGFGISFGIVARAAGMGWLAPLVMSATTFAGSAQFAAASVLGAIGGVAAAIVAAILLNGRYLPIGVSVTSALTGGRLRRFLHAQLLVDESWAVAHLGKGQYSRGRLVGAGLLVYAAWVGGTAFGVLGAGILGNPAKFGLDVVSPVLFLALLSGQLKSRSAVYSSILGAGIALALIPFTAAGVPLIAATAACMVGWRSER